MRRSLAVMDSVLTNLAQRDMYRDRINRLVGRMRGAEFIPASTLLIAMREMEPYLAPSTARTQQFLPVEVAVFGERYLLDILHARYARCSD